MGVLLDTVTVALYRNHMNGKVFTCIFLLPFLKISIRFFICPAREKDVTKNSTGKD